MADQNVRVISNPQDLPPLRDFWQSAVKNPNADFDFYGVILKSRPEIKAPAVGVLYNGEQPQALLIGRIEESRMEVKLGYFTVMRPGVRLLIVIYGGVAGDLSEESAGLLIAAMRAHSIKNRCDAILFHNLPVASAVFKAIQNQAPFFLRDHVILQNHHRSAEFSGSQDDFLVKVGRNHRSKLRHQGRQIEDEFKGRMQVRHFLNESDVPLLCRDAEAVSKKGYQRAIGGGFINNAEMVDRLSLYARVSSLQGAVLYIDNSPSAFWIGTRYKGTLFLDFTGYDPAFQKFGLGTYLFLKMVDDFRKNGHGSRIDFGPGDAVYKQRFGDNEWLDTQLMLFSPTGKGAALNLIRQLESFLTLLSRKILSGKIIQSIKTAWRKRLRGKDPL